MRRLTLEYVRERFAERGFVLLADSYSNAHEKLKFKCNKGHLHEMTYGNFSSGGGCGQCANENTGNRTRMDFDIIKESFTKEGYEILTKEYKNSTQKLEYICPVGHKHSVGWSAWKNGNRCAVCAGQVLKTIEEIRESFEGRGYVLVSTEYAHCSEKLKYVCPNGHEGKIGWHSWKYGSGCPACFRMRSKKNIKDVRQAFADRGYVLLSTEYIDAYSHLDYICPNGHKNSMAWNNFQQGTGCPVCGIETTKKKLKKSTEEVRMSFEKDGYVLLTKRYTNSQQKLKFQCPRGHIHSMAYSHWNNGARCIKCFQEDNFGSGNPMWRGGISFEPYCHIWKDKEYREYLKERDKEKFCWNPQCLGNGSLGCFHHIDYDKKDCHPKNIIKICNSCNAAANFNRNWWKSFYTEINRRRLA